MNEGDDVVPTAGAVKVPDDLANILKSETRVISGDGRVPGGDYKMQVTDLSVNLASK